MEKEYKQYKPHDEMPWTPNRLSYARWSICVFLFPFPPASASFVETCGDSLDRIVTLYEQTLQDGLGDIRSHLPTLLEYARRVTSIAELGVARGLSSIAFARAALEAATRGEEYRYRMYDIVHAPGVENIWPFLVDCQHVDLDFRKGDVLDQSFLRTVGEVDGSFPSPELLFIDTAHTREQLTQELNAFAPFAKSYIILHDTETFGDQDETVHDDGTLYSYRRKRELLREHQTFHLANLMQSESVSSIDDLHMEQVEEVLEKAQADMDQLGAGLRVAIRSWLEGPAAGEWEVLEHSLADNGLTVLGRVKAFEAKVALPGFFTWENSTKACHVKLAEIRGLAKDLLRFKASRFPSSLQPIVFGPWKVQEIRRKLRSAASLCPGHWETKAALRMLEWHSPGTSISTAKRPAGTIYAAQSARHPDIFFTILNEIRSSGYSSQKEWIELLEEGVLRWPQRLEAWLFLADTLTPLAAKNMSNKQSLLDCALHAWRRCLVLAARNRHVAAAALEALRHFGRGDEAEASWKRLSGKEGNECKEQIWDPEGVMDLRLTIM